MPRLIGLAGCIGSGKTEVAKYLGSRGYEVEAYGTAIKLGAAAIYGVPLENFYGTPEGRARVDQFWGISYREMLQKFGTEVVRFTLGDDFWVAALWRKHEILDGDLVIEDCRFPNEAEAVLDRGGIIIEILRPQPEQREKPWWERCLDYMSLDQHISEKQLPNELVTYQINNDATIEQLHSVVDKILGFQNEE